MRREYQITIDFVMDDYDYEQEGDQMLSTLRRIVESYGDRPVSVRPTEGAVVE